jgi:hypothetical protein
VAHTPLQISIMAAEGLSPQVDVLLTDESIPWPGQAATNNFTWICLVCVEERDADDPDPHRGK